MFVIVLFLCLALTNQEKLGRVYDKSGCNGRAHELDSREGDPDLTIYSGPDKKWLSANFTGAWLFYLGKRYTKLLEIQDLYHSNWKCISFALEPEEKIQSVRPVRAFNRQGITFYEEVNFESYQVHVDDKEASIWVKAASYIVTGGSSWTVYGGDNFNGNSNCIIPTNTLFEPTFVRDSTIPILSAKIGCDE